MKKLLFIAIATCTSLSIHAAKGDSTLAEFQAGQKKQAEGKSWNYDSTKSEKLFHTIDADSDGIVSSVEKKAYWAKREAAKKAKPVSAQKPAIKKSKGQSLAKFLAEQKAKSADKGWKYREEKSTEIFNLMDTDHDGFISSAEKKSYWAKKGK